MIWWLEKENIYQLPKNKNINIFCQKWKTEVDKIFKYIKTKSTYFMIILSYINNKKIIFNKNKYLVGGIDI